MSLADRVIYALEATPEQAAELRQLTGEALTAKMREIMHANGLSQIEVQRRLYSIGSLWAGQQDTRKRRTGFRTVASTVGYRGTAHSQDHGPHRQPPHRKAPPAGAPTESGTNRQDRMLPVREDAPGDQAMGSG